MPKDNQLSIGTCVICGQQKPLKQLTPVELIRDVIIQLVRNTKADWDGTGFICSEDLTRLRADYVESILKKQNKEISSLEHRVLKSLKEQEVISQNINQAFDRQLTIGERLADQVAEFGGSWKFISFFGGVLFFWILINTLLLTQKPFDPYPFILLNLVLSCLAALQAPIIMMSQNRQEDRDRLRSEEDYRVNLKAELEIRHLNEKIDHLLGRQWQRLLEIQQIQLDLIEDLAMKKVKTVPLVPVSYPHDSTAQMPVISPQLPKTNENGSL